MHLGKKAAGYAAADQIPNGAVVGIGTGSTVAYFIERLGERCKQGLSIKGIVTSLGSEQKAKEVGIPLISIDSVQTIAITVDGADQIDPSKRMIKGGGGALLREKIVATTSKEVLIIVDESKCVPQLGNCPLPVEIVPFGYLTTVGRIEKSGFSGNLRKTPGGSLFKTDGGNFIYDIALSGPVDNPEETHSRIIDIPGVIETGFFFNIATRILVGLPDGKVRA